MAKNCTICSQSETIQKRVRELHQSGKSQREMETSLADEFNLKVSYSAIGRHLAHHEGKNPQISPVNEGIDLQEIDSTPPENTTVHQELCNVLTNTLRIFNKTIGDMAQQGSDPQILLDVVKTLDVLINGFEKLYQNPKEGVTSNQQKITFSDLQLKIMKEVAELPETAKDGEVKAKITEVLKNHEALTKNAKDD